MSEVKQKKRVSVVATAVGFDNLCIRQIGEQFSMPESAFDKRPKLDKDGKEIDGEFYDAPSWFKRVEDEPAGKKGRKGADDLV